MCKGWVVLIILTMDLAFIKSGWTKVPGHTNNIFAVSGIIRTQRVYIFSSGGYTYLAVQVTIYAIMLSLNSQVT